METFTRPAPRVAPDWLHAAACVAASANCWVASASSKGRGGRGATGASLATGAVGARGAGTGRERGADAGAGLATGAGLTAGAVGGLGGRGTDGGCTGAAWPAERRFSFLADAPMFIADEGAEDSAAAADRAAAGDGAAAGDSAAVPGATSLPAAADLPAPIPAAGPAVMDGDSDTARIPGAAFATSDPSGTGSGSLAPVAARGAPDTLPAGADVSLEAPTRAPAGDASALRGASAFSTCFGAATTSAWC